TVEGEELLARGDSETQCRLAEVAGLLTGDASAIPQDGLASFEMLFAETELGRPPYLDEATLKLLASSVNEQRLANFPLKLSAERIMCLYEELTKS
ncbi:MAG: hypothetical protein Q4B54_12635, partial [Coriobacteriales bacterium]|nr:hypothetical protein [Coriobacteriales bacterium]